MTPTETHRNVDAYLTSVEALLPAARRQNLFSVLLHPSPVLGFIAPVLLGSLSVGLFVVLAFLTSFSLVGSIIISLMGALMAYTLIAQAISARTIRRTPARERLEGDLLSLERVLHEAGDSLPHAGAELMAMSYSRLSSVIADIRAQLP